MDTVRAPLAFAWEALELAAPGSAASLFVSSASVVLGAKDFRAPAGPRGLGGVRSAMCFVFVLRPGANLDLPALLRPVPRAAAPVPLWTWAGPRGEGDADTVLVHAAMVDSTYFVVGNSRDEVLAAADALSSKGESQTVAALMEAGLAKEPVWGYRRYRHGQVADPMAAGTADIAASTEALVVVPGPKDVVVRLLGNADDSTAKRLNARTYFPPFTQVKPGVWQAKVPVVAKDEPTAAAVLGVLYLLGFGVYL